MEYANAIPQMTRAPTTLAAAETRIAALISSELEQKALVAIAEALNAEVYVRAARGKDGIEYRAVPDHAVRLAAGVKLLEFSRGKPATTLALVPAPKANTASQSINDLIRNDPEAAERILYQLLSHARSVVPIAPAKDTPG